VAGPAAKQDIAYWVNLTDDGLPEPVETAEFTLAMGDTVGWTHLYDTRSGELSGVPLAGHLSSVDVFGFTADGRTLLTGDDQRIKLWDLASRREVASVRHTATIIFAAFSADEMMRTQRLKTDH
jgi:WD40 repeat protein